MQESKTKKNEEICKLLGNVVKVQLGKKKKSILAYESDLPRSVVYYILDGKKATVNNFLASCSRAWDETFRTFKVA